MNFQKLGQNLPPHQQQHSQTLHFKKVDQSQLEHRLKPGRHHCNCQSRVHRLVRNCLSCGRIVCEQEGSGPCMFCGTLVCTREERQILNENSERSRELLAKITSNMNGPPGFDSLTLVSQGILQKANDYRKKLLIADKSEEVTRVRDLDNDYFTIETNPFLTFEEREAIVRRKNELKEMAEKERKKVVISLDLVNRAASEEKRSTLETVEDPVIQSILQNSMIRRTKEANFSGQNAEANLDENERRFFNEFQPKYVQQLSHIEQRKSELSETMKNLKMRRVKGTVYCIALKQPFASMLVDEENNFLCVPWKKQLFLRGQVVIGALNDSYQNLIYFGQFTKSKNELFPTNQQNLPSNALIGRAFLKECITWKEYNDEFEEHSKAYPIDSGYVLIFSSAERLPQPIPFEFTSEFFELDRTHTSVINRMLETDSLFDDCDITL